MVRRTDIRLWLKFSDHLNASTIAVYPIVTTDYYNWSFTALLWQQILAQMHTSLCYIYCGLAAFYGIWKSGRNNSKYNSHVCAFVLKFPYSSQQYNEMSIIANSLYHIAMWQFWTFNFQKYWLTKGFKNIFQMTHIAVHYFRVACIQLMASHWPWLRDILQASA